MVLEVIYLVKLISPWSFPTSCCRWGQITCLWSNFRSPPRICAWPHTFLSLYQWYCTQCDKWDTTFHWWNPSIQNPKDHEILQQDLNTLTKWANAWLMEFNIPKCNILQITTNFTKRNFTYKMSDIPLNTVLEHDYLGVHLHHKLSWSPHVDHICNKASRLLGFLNETYITHQYISRNTFISSCCSLPLSIVQPSGTLTI